jgi:hypothetical protein
MPDFPQAARPPDDVARHGVAHESCLECLKPLVIEVILA